MEDSFLSPFFFFWNQYGGIDEEPQTVLTLVVTITEEPTDITSDGVEAVTNIIEDISDLDSASHEVKIKSNAAYRT